MEELDQNLSALLDKYLLGTLEAEEAKQWEQVRHTAAWKRELALRQDLILASKSLERDKLKVEFQELEQKQFTSPPVAKKRLSGSRLYFAIAAIFALLLLVWVSFPSQKISHQDLFASHFEAYPNHLVMITRDTGVVSTPLGKTFAAYEQGKYALVVEQLRAVETTDSLQITEAQRRFYLGIALLGSGQTQEGVKELSWFTPKKEELLKDPAEWYLALGLLKMNKVEEARQQLREILNQTDHPFRNEAERLLEEL